MEYETSFDYAGNSLNGNSCSDKLLFTPNIFNAPDYDFSNMLNLSPLVSESQMNMLEMHVNPQLARAKMPGSYVDGSEYFPTFPASAPPMSWMMASAIVPAALPMATFSDLPADKVPLSIPLQGQIEPKSDTLVAQQGADIQQCEAERTRIAGKKRAKQATCPPCASQEPKPKKRRGARRKVRTEEELAIRREKHLQRNKYAAQKCRQKRRVLEDEIKENMAIERQKNLVIWNQVGSVQDELEPLRNLVLDIHYHCYSDDHKTSAKTGLEAIMKMATKLQDSIDICNQRRAQISHGLVMQRSFSGYAQQDSLWEGSGSTHDSQSPALSPQNSTGFSEQILSPRSTRGSSYATGRLNTDLVNGNRTTRKVSNVSSTHPDSAVEFDSPPGAMKDSPVEDEAIEIPVSGKEEFLPSAGLDKE
ncbi:hypothetical protein WAI453_006479 [Rhynchosporium graminicola]